MTSHATGAFQFTSWDELTYSEVESGPKLTRASVVNKYEGDITGAGTLAFLMAYPPDSDVSFVGYEQIVGTLHGREGSFVLAQTGAFADGAARCTWQVVPGSGTGDLRGLRGEGSYVAHHEQPTSYTLDYDLE